jgi:hypothetical protein
MQQLAKVIMQILCRIKSSREKLKSPLKNVIIKRVEKTFDPVCLISPASPHTSPSALPELLE